MESPNLNFFLKLSNEDRQFMMRLTNTLKMEFTNDKNLYFDALAQKDYKKMKFIVHRIKHKVGLLGLTKSYNVVIEFENDLINENLKLKDKFLLILNTMTKYLEKIN